MNFCKTLAFLVLVFLFGGCKKEEPIVPADQSFPIDPEFESLLVSMKIDPYRNGMIRQSDIMRIDSLNLNASADVRSLRGIEHFENLRTLIISNLQIDSLDLTKNTELEYVRVETVGPEDTGRSLKYLDVSTLKKLWYLHCGQNSLTKVDVSQNALLRELYCGGNFELAELDISGNPQLEVLDFGMTQVANVDISNNTRLSRIMCALTKMSSLDLSKLTGLKVLDCTETKIARLDIPSPSAMEEMYLTNSGVTDIDFSQYRNLKLLGIGNNVKNPDLRPLKQLKMLDCYGMRSSAIDLSGNANLEVLSTRLSDFRSLDLSANQNLKTLFMVKMNYITTLDLSKINLESFSSVHNYNLKTICVKSIPAADDLLWGEEEWTEYKICR